MPSTDGPSTTTRWRLSVLLTAATASALIAGCCGGPLSADDKNCSGCVCGDDAGAPDASDAGDASGDASHASDASDDAD